MFKKKGYRVPQGEKVDTPGLYAIHAHEEWKLFCDTVAKNIAADTWTFMTKQHQFKGRCQTMLDLNPNCQFAPGTGFSTMSATCDLARGVHTDEHSRSLLLCKSATAARSFALAAVSSIASLASSSCS